jgi:hypothetical protein
MDENFDYGDQFNESDYDDAMTWEENEVFQDECLERAEHDEDDYGRDEGDDNSPYDDDRDFGMDG